MIKVDSHKTPGVKCPTCGTLLDAATGYAGRGPSPGDFSICVKCKTWLIYTDDLGQREATDEDVAKLSPVQLATLVSLTEHLMSG